MVFKNSKSNYLGIIPLLLFCLLSCKTTNNCRLSFTEQGGNFHDTNFELCLDVQSSKCLEEYAQANLHQCYKPVLVDSNGTKFWKFKVCEEKMQCLSSTMPDECFLLPDVMIGDSTTASYYLINQGPPKDNSFNSETKLLSVLELRKTTVGKILLSEWESRTINTKEIFAIDIDPVTNSTEVKTIDKVRQKLKTVDIDKMPIWFTAKDAVDNSPIYNKIPLSDLSVLSNSNDPCYIVAGNPAYETDNVNNPIYK